MTNQVESGDFERRLADALHAAAPVAPAGLADRLLDRTTAVNQRRGWFAPRNLVSSLAIAAVVTLAVVVGLQVGGMLPSVGDPPIGTEGPSASPSAVPSTAPTPTPTPMPTTTPEPSAESSRCDNATLGYAVSTPPGWFGNEAVTPDDPELDPIPACQYFAEQPFEVRPNAGLPPTVAISFSRQADAPPPSDGAIMLSTEEVTVAGRPATVRETEGTTEDAFFGAGDRAYEYLVSLPDGDILWVSTTTDADGDYTEHKRVLDLMMESLDLTGA
jgi:hypothetical protein